MLDVLSLSSVRTNIYFPNTIMRKMIEAYSFDDFKTTRLYASIKSWQDLEGVVALAA